MYISISISSVAQLCPTLGDLMNRSTPGLPVYHQLLEFTQTHFHRVIDVIQPSHPLSSPSPPALNPSQHQGLFQRVNSLHEVTKVLKFQPQHQSFQRNPRTGLLQDELVGSPLGTRKTQITLNNQFNLIDIYRKPYSAARQYLFFSCAHETRMKTVHIVSHKTRLKRIRTKQSIFLAHNEKQVRNQSQEDTWKILQILQKFNMFLK